MCRSKHSGLVSIPIATYDRIDVLIDRTLPALFAQDYANIEVIVVTDGTPAPLLERFKEVLDPRFRLVRLKKRSKYPSDPLSLWMVAGCRPRNVGAKNARGEYLLWMSDDDELLPDAVGKLVEKIESEPSWDTVSAMYRTDNDVLYGMPGWLWRYPLHFFRWNRHSYRKTWNRPADLDLEERFERAGVQMGHLSEIIAVQHPVPGTNLFGSRGAVAEERARRKQSGPFQDDD